MAAKRVLRPCHRAGALCLPVLRTWLQGGRKARSCSDIWSGMLARFNPGLSHNLSAGQSTCCGLMALQAGCGCGSCGCERAARRAPAGEA